MRHPLLCEALGAEVWVKHENHLPTGAFKVRGGLNLVAAEHETLRRTGVITASTGNHGQSIALACQRYGVTCRVFVPEGNNPEKNAAMRAFGAEVVEHGRDFDAAREEVERLAASTGVRYIHSANEPLLIAGVGVYALEIFDELPHVDVVIAPIGGGSGASGLVTVRNGLSSPAQIWGVQAAGADALFTAFVSTLVTRAGTKPVLIASSLFIVLAGAGLGLGADHTLLSFVIVLGVISPAGFEGGPFSALEQAILPRTIHPEQLAKAFSWYNLAGFGAPYVMGLIKTATGTVSSGLYLVAAIEILAAVLVVFGIRRLHHKREA